MRKMATRGAAVLSLVFLVGSVKPGEGQAATAPGGQATSQEPGGNLNDPGFVGFENRNFKVQLHVDHPFVFFDEANGRGNERFSGITVDILEKLGKMLFCTYTYQITEEEDDHESATVALQTIGAYTPPGSVKTADLAAGAIHITANRSQYVHFSLPYYDTYYRMVVKRPVSEVNIFSFFKPFSWQLWLLIVCEIVIFGVCFFVMEGPYLNPGLVDKSDVIEGAVGLLDSIYWAAGAVTGAKPKAKTWSGRIALFGHGLFWIIILPSYTAHLASSLTQLSLVSTITSFLDVALSGGEYKMAVPSGLSHEDYLASEYVHHGYVFDYDTTDTWEESLELVKDDSSISASFMDEPNVLYYLLHDLMGKVSTEEMCKLMVLPGTFRPAGYGLAFPQDSMSFVLFSRGIMQLKEDGMINKIVNNATYLVGRDAETWVSGNCTTTSTTSEEFTPEQFYGLCIMSGMLLLAGLILSVFERHARLKAAALVSPGGEDDGGSVTPEMQAAILAGVEAGVKAGVEAGIRAGMKHIGGKSGGAAYTSVAIVPDTSVAMPTGNQGGDDTVSEYFDK
mmetsp:Transcript_57906/g.138102  ORF Transcript_57906/g.138102 Transcript_57906/m.138102 type:complete len:564 (+) Transcript_57906:2-1693(+)